MKRVLAQQLDDLAMHQAPPRRVVSQLFILSQVAFQSN
jgi:hypothetical protein